MEDVKDLKKYLEDIKDYFMTEVYPDMNRIARALLRFNQWKAFDGYGEVQGSYKYNGVKIHVQCGDITFGGYRMTVKYRFKTVLEYTSHNIGGLRVFHECGWLEKLDGAAEEIERKFADRLKRIEDKALKTRTRNFSRRCENG